MNLFKRIIGFTFLIFTLLLCTAVTYGAELKDYTVGSGVITVISKTADGTVLETKTPNLTAGDMAKLTAKTTVTNNGTAYTFSHFEYHTSARDYVASYDNPMDLYVDPPMTIYAVYTNGDENTSAYVSDGATGFYKDPVTDGTNTYLFCSVAGTDNLESTEIKAVLSAANSVALEGTTMETVTVNNNTETSTTKLFSKTVKSMQFIVAVPIANAINAEILAGDYTNIGRTKTWNFESAAFDSVAQLSSGTNNITVNGLSFSRVPSSPSTSTIININGTKYSRGIKQDTGKTITVPVTKGDIVEIYGRGNSSDSVLSIGNATLASGTGKMSKETGSLNTYVADGTGNMTISISSNNGYFYCIKVNPVNPAAVETQSTTEAATTTTEETTTEVTTNAETTTKTETTSETTTEATVSSDTVWHKYWVYSSDVPDGETNDTDYFTGVTTGSTTIKAGDTTLNIDGTNYTFTRRTSSTTPTITFTVPAGYEANVYFVSYSSGSSGRTVTVSSTEGGGFSDSSNTTSTSSEAPNVATVTGLTDGEYQLTTSGKVNYSFIAVKLIQTLDPTKGHINVTVKNLNGNTVFDAVVNANTTSLAYNNKSGLYIGTNLEPGTYTITASKTINGTDYTASDTVNVTANSTATPELTLNYGTGNISVSVINTAGTAITKATVTAVYGSETVTLKYDSTSGAYTANDVITGNYTVTAEIDGVSGTADVTVAQGQTAAAEIDIDIDPNAYLYIDIQDQLSQPFNTTDTTTVTNYAELTSALAAYNASSSGGTIYIDAPKIECEGQLRITGENISLIGVVQEELSTDKYKVFPVLDFSKFRASSEGINASDPLAITKGSDSDAGIRINGNYNLIQNLIVEKAPDNGIQLKAVDDGNNAEQTKGLANYNIIENCIARYNNDTGIQVSAPMPLAGTGIVEKASYNTFKWCYSYRNCDVYTFGGNADGFAPKLNTRTGNVFDHCYAWDNSDDGWDAYDKSASSNTTEKGADCDTDVTADITYKNSACWNNGNREVFSGVYDRSKGYPVDTNLFVYEILSSQNIGYDGTNFSSVAGNASINTSKGNVTWSSWYTTADSEMNGNGFKFGSGDTPKATTWQYSSTSKVYEMKRDLENCLSFDHKSKGFDNNNTSGINGYFTNTIGFDNKYNYYISGYNLKAWTNAMGFDGSSSDKLPSGYSATTPSSASQAEIREEVEDKAWRIFEACQANVIPGGAEFNIYN